MKLKLAYFGTPDFSARFLEKILTDPEIPTEVTLVVTQPDKPVGRRGIVTKTPVKITAEKHGIDVYDGDSKSKINSELYTLNSKLRDIDLALVYAFGEIIPASLLAVPRLGFCNVHPSFLPKYRGPSPMATPIINGDIETGVTLIKMDEKIDHGPIIAQKKVAIGEKDRRPDLERKLTDLGYKLFKQHVRKLGIKELNEKEQDHKQATFTKRMTKNDGFIEFVNLKSLIIHHPEKVFNLFRGLFPWPGIWTTISAKQKTKSEKSEEKRLKITDMDLVDGKLIIKKVQLEGKNKVDFVTFTRAYPDLF